MDNRIQLPALRDFRHNVALQLRFNDIDILGHLNNTVYFSLYDLGKARYMQEVGLRNKGNSRPDTVIADIHCTYLKPIHFDDEISVFTRCREIGEKHYVLQQVLADREGDIRSVCDTVMVYLDPEEGRPVPLPEDYKKKIINFENRD